MRLLKDVIAERENGRRPLRGNPDLPESISGLNLSVEPNAAPRILTGPGVLMARSLPVLGELQPEPATPGLWPCSFVYRVAPSYVLFRYCDDNQRDEEQHAMLEAYTDLHGWLREECYNGWCSDADEYETSIPADLPCYHLLN
jgi:hypothetical protein